jgi:acyl carrier protein
MDQATRSAIRQFICDNFLVEERAFGDEDSLLGKNILDSTGILELVSFLEHTFDIKVADEELMPANLDSVTQECRFLDRKLEAAKTVR